MGTLNNGKAGFHFMKEKIDARYTAILLHNNTVNLNEHVKCKLGNEMRKM